MRAGGLTRIAGGGFYPGETIPQPHRPFTIGVVDDDGTWTVPLPSHVTEPFEVYVNGVLQQRGVDYTVESRALSFVKPLAKEGRLGLLRWASIFLGIAGTYRKNDSVDVVYEAGGRKVVATGLPIIPPGADAPL
jgi:hypothetical protein